MHTTSKYIFEEKEIDPTTFCEPGTKSLTIKAEKGKKNSSPIALFEIDRYGRISTACRNSCWTAVPTITEINRAQSINKPPKFSSKEVFSYKEGLLISSKTIDNSSGITQSNSVHTYENRKSSKIIIKGLKGSDFLLDEHEITRNNRNQIIKKTRTLDIKLGYKIVLQHNFKRDALGLIIEKQIKNVTHIGDSEISYQIIENLEYNSQNQLIKSTKTNLFENQQIITKIKFDYLNSLCDKISKIESIETDQDPLTTRYTYLEYLDLNDIQIEQRGHKMTNKYIREIE